MNHFFKVAFVYFAKIKVIHSIPGRLRLQIPGLDKVPENMKQYEHYVTSIIKMVDGVEDITYSYITGKILLTYNPKLTNEKKIISWIELAWKKIIENENLYSGMSVEEIQKNLDKFYKILCNELKKGK